MTNIKKSNNRRHFAKERFCDGDWPPLVKFDNNEANNSGKEGYALFKKPTEKSVFFKQL